MLMRLCSENIAKIPPKVENLKSLMLIRLCNCTIRKYKIYTLINIKNWILTFGTEPISKSLIKNLFHIKKYDTKNPKGVTELVKNLISCIFNIKLLVLSQ